MILIVDFGSQTAHLIGRRLRALGIPVSYTLPENLMGEIERLSPKGMIFSGSPASVLDVASPNVDLKVFDLKIPILGICYGWQLMANLLGGVVKKHNREYGPERIQFKEDFFGLKLNECQVIMSHGDWVEHPPEGFKIFGSTKKVHCAAAVDPKKKLFGVQFHPEVDDTEKGNDILKFFAVDVAGCALTSHSLDPDKLIQDILETVGDREVICAVSGGVDSSVAAYLIQKAIGKRLHPIYIENGLMRFGTKERVLKQFEDPVVYDAKKMFLDALKGVTESETKRKIIGRLYIDLFHEEAEKFPKAVFLAQGTIYSDVIESKGTKHASKIKSHHNVGGLPDTLKLKLLEPLRDYYKDEVRQIGRMIGMPEEFIKEHPFPGPGYAVRIRGEVTEKRLEQVKAADRIIVEEITKAGLYDKLFQCFPVMTGAFSTAVKGDEGVFAEVIALRAYESVDIMTSQWARLPYELLQKISSRIVNEVPDVSRVVYDISNKPPSTMEWE